MWVAAPGGNGTMIRIGLAGKVCAAAALASPALASTLIARSLGVTGSSRRLARNLRL
jgi:hypothetical protein